MDGAPASTTLEFIGHGRNQPVIMSDASPFDLHALPSCP